MASSFTDARKRQLARLGGAKPPTARKGDRARQVASVPRRGRRPSHAAGLRD